MRPTRVVIKNKRGQVIASLDIPEPELFSCESVEIHYDSRPHPRRTTVFVHEAPELGVTITSTEQNRATGESQVVNQHSVFERKQPV